MKFYMLVCLECTPVLPMPFHSLRERGKWAAEHTHGTGHESWRVWDEEAPTPGT